MLISAVHTNVEFGEERTNATNNRALMIEMRFKKKERMYERIPRN